MTPPHLFRAAVLCLLVLPALASTLCAAETSVFARQFLARVNLGTRYV